MSLSTGICFVKQFVGVRYVLRKETCLALTDVLKGTGQFYLGLSQGVVESSIAEGKLTIGGV